MATATCRAACRPSLTLEGPEVGTKTWTAGQDSSSGDPLLGQKSSFEAPSLVGDILGDSQATRLRSLWLAASI